MAIRIAIIGYGKIAHDEHRPAIVGNTDFTLVATAGGHGQGVPAIAHYADHRAMLADRSLKLDAVAVCTPPGPRFAIARDCMTAGLDVLLEKPPCATLGAVGALARRATNERRTLFAAWHSQFAPAVIPARAALEGTALATLAIEWREDVRRWHPGQDWVLAHGGFGVFDAAINALSLVTAIVETPLIVESATVLIPSNREAPIAAALVFTGDQGRADFDWRVDDRESRRVVITTANGRTLAIDAGGRTLAIDGVAQAVSSQGEYAPMYARFAELIAARQSAVDVEPLRIVADAFLIGERKTVAAFD